MVLLQLLQGGLQLDILLHASVVVFLRVLLKLLIELFFSCSHHELFAILPLHELFSDFGFILFSLKVLRLLSVGCYMIIFRFDF